MTVIHSRALVTIPSVPENSIGTIWKRMVCRVLGHKPKELFFWKTHGDNKIHVVRMAGNHACPRCKTFAYLYEDVK